MPHRHPRSYAQFRLISAAELDAQRYPKTLAQRFQQHIQQILNRLKAKLLADSDLQVWHTQDARGNILWSAYDPTSGHSINQISETEMRIWIEQRHQRL